MALVPALGRIRLMAMTDSAETGLVETSIRDNTFPHGPSRKSIWIALIAAVLASIGDFGLLYVSQQAGDPKLGWPPPPPGTLALSQWLGAFSIPLYAVGYVTLSKGLVGHARTIVFWFGIYTSALGGVVHGLTGLSIQSDVVEGRPLSGPFALDPTVLPFLVPFVAIVTLGLLVASVAWSFAILRGRSDYPRSFGYLSPLTCICAVIVAGLPFHYGQLFVIPMAPNLGCILFFAAGLRFVRKNFLLEG